MNSDYRSEAEREAYRKGIIARINGLSVSDNKYVLPRTRKAWQAGFDEKGSIKEKADATNR